MGNDKKSKVLETNESVYDGLAERHSKVVCYQSRKGTRDYLWDIIEKIHKNPGGGDLLEVACGSGTFVELAKKWKMASYEGIDISGNMIKVATKSHGSDKIKFYKSSLEDWEDGHKGKYDIIISSSFLHHLYDLDEGLEQIKSMLKPGGIYIGVHEVDNTRVTTRLEKFDLHWAVLMGHGYTGFWDRLRVFLKFMCSGKIFFKEKKSTARLQEDMVDFRLNEKFYLPDEPVIKRLHAKVVPYCFYNYPIFARLKPINNFQMVVMKNDI
ncbi:MAG: class I SAM-dependent methyltransferase [Deltaproteobacteria bacterium]|jgi:ubiquinone/menaquinone biosynthesis C-methylase UbiE|nr:class I SAM-dependent methyltransferase [Deltaproteobacteria bacterium]